MPEEKANSFKDLYLQPGFSGKMLRRCARRLVPNLYQA